MPRDQAGEKPTAMVRARKYVVIRRFKGMPKRSDFKIVEYDLPQLRNQKILVKVEWISVDPYLLNSSYATPYGYDQYSYQIGMVIQSRNKKIPEGTRVVSHQGWCDYCILDPSVKVKSMHFSTANFGVYKLPDMKGLPISMGPGAIGMPGATAYFGLLEVCKPQEGDTLVVTSAAGAVGSIVGQTAKIRGCKVIGLTGSDAKVNWLTEELGFDKALNYKNEDIATALKQAAPDGIDYFFDNVGGKLSYIIMKQMKIHAGKVTICGSISAHDEASSKMFPPNVFQPIVLVRQLKVEGFLVFRLASRWGLAFKKLTEWITRGDIKIKEHVTEGFDNIVDAFMGMLNGENYGKAVVKI